MERVEKTWEYKKIYLDYYFGTNIILLDTDIIFECWGKAKTIMLRNIARKIFENIKVTDIAYFQSKLKDFWATKKDRDFYTWAIQYFIMDKQKWN